jgi:mannose-6-phosphate isomerase-like protein (cupin superfamily)
MKSFCLFFVIFFAASLKAQQVQNLDTIGTSIQHAQVWLKPMYHDSLVSSFVIVIPTEVKKHKHISHSEHVYILEGEGEMLLGDKKFKVKKGDFIFIPKGTVHALKVTSKEPVKVISLQAPYFDGKDRILVSE